MVDISGTGHRDYARIIPTYCGVSIRNREVGVVPNLRGIYY